LQAPKTLRAGPPGLDCTYTKWNGAMPVSTTPAVEALTNDLPAPPALAIGCRDVVGIGLGMEGEILDKFPNMN
jgi:hypothetical protein